MYGRVSIDIETECGLACPDACDHALDPYKSRITVIGAVWKEGSAYASKVFRSLEEFKAWADKNVVSAFGFNFKFDNHVLFAHGVDLRAKWDDDVLLMATTHTDKVPEEYLMWYEATRRELNATLPKGKGHRKAAHHSLKVLAPFFLGVEAFWEATLDHDNDEYVIKDALYTHQLYDFFEQKLNENDTYSFYKNKLLPWSKLLLEMEIRGVRVDTGLIKKEQQASIEKAASLKKEIDNIWSEAYSAYHQKKLQELKDKYNEMTAIAIAKQPDVTKHEKIVARYQGLYEKAKPSVDSTLNLDSPAQLKWLLQDYFQLDISDFHDEESTGKPVLKKLAGEGRRDIELFLEYRGQRKLSTAFFPSYMDMQIDGVIHCSFNPYVARTGRLSSSSPNLQQVPRNLHHLFVAREGYSLLTKDQSAIEPRLIAYTTEDPVLFTILDKDLDFHGYNAKIFFDLKEDVNDIKKLYPLEREVGKEVGLAILYGAGGIRLQESAQKRGFKWSLEECKDKVKKFRENYLAVEEYRRQLNKQLEKGPAFNMFGRPFAISDPQDIYMKGFNSYVQGSASDLVLNSAHKMQKEFKESGVDAHVILLVHDEIVVEARDEHIQQAESIMEKCMTNYKLTTSYGDIKLKVEGKTSKSWEK